MKIPDKVYDILKYIAQILLPALGTAYAGLAEIWGWPASDKVVATILVIDAFLGIILGISTEQYLRRMKSQTVYTETTTTADGQPYYTTGYIAPVEPGGAAAQETSSTSTTT